jgi:hypothetical protein
MMALYPYTKQGATTNNKSKSFAQTVGVQGPYPLPCATGVGKKL